MTLVMFGVFNKQGNAKVFPENGQSFKLVLKTFLLTTLGGLRRLTWLLRVEICVS